MSCTLAKEYLKTISKTLWDVSPCTGMRIGYPCINRSIGCRVGRTFRFAPYSRERLFETVTGNLECLGVLIKNELSSVVRSHREYLISPHKYKI
jgi:hypothetical protein